MTAVCFSRLQFCFLINHFKGKIIMYFKNENGVVYETATLPANATKLTVAAGKAAVKQQAINSLLQLLKPAQTVHCILRKVSVSGMSRRISFVIFRDDGLICNLDRLISLACGYKHSDKQGLVVGGCGMDMGFSVVHNLGAVLWPEGTPSPHGSRNGEPDIDGGYALKHNWI